MPAPAHPSSADEQRFHALGTEVRILLSGPADPTLPAELAGSFTRFEAVASRFDAASELNELARGARRAPSGLLADLVAAAEDVEERTAGLVTSRLRRRLEAAGYDRSAPWRPQQGSAACPAPETPNDWSEWDFGGVGKGFAVDRAVALAEGRCAGVLIDAGGDIAVAGAAPDGGPWRVGLTGGAGVVALRNGGVATSSTLRRRWRTARGVAHHLIDPETGRPAASDVVTASAWARSALWAEVAAKALVLRGSRWVEQVHIWLPEVVLSWRTTDGAVTVERAFEEEVLAWAPRGV